MNLKSHIAARFAIGCLAVLLLNREVEGVVVIFRNDADVPIRFSLRATTSSAPVTERLEVKGRIQFDLPENVRFDFCGTGLDELNGTFGASNVDLSRLLANMKGNEVGVNGTLVTRTVFEFGRWIEKQQRAAILLEFPMRDGRDLVVTAGPVCADFANWFYYCRCPREPIAGVEVPMTVRVVDAKRFKQRGGDFRIWTNDAGINRVARLIRAHGSTAYFSRQDGTTASALISNLSAADRQWIRDWQAKQLANAATNR